MVKNIVKAIVVIAAVVGMVGVIQSSKANATVQVLSNVEICHSRQPEGSNGQGQGAQNNPYGPSSQTVSVSSIFGNNGHDNHDGPVFNGTGQNFWGDIIPPFWYMTSGRNAHLEHYDGKNWNAAGQAIYNNDCQFSPTGVSSYNLDCEKITLSAPTGVKPAGASYQYYIDDVATALGAKTVTAGNHTIKLKVNGVLVDTDNVHVDTCKVPEKVTICHRTDAVKSPYIQESVSKNAVNGEGENDHTHHTGPVATSEAVAQALKDSETKWGDIIPPFGDYAGYNWTAEGQAIYNNGCNFVPFTTFSWKCVEATTSFVATFTNNGGANSSVSVNDQNATVTPGETKDLTVVTGKTSVQVKVTVDGVVVFDRGVACFQGQGGVGGTVTPAGGQGAATGVTSLPYTGSAGSQIASLIALIATVGTAIGGYVLRNRAVSSL